MFRGVPLNMTILSSARESKRIRINLRATKSGWESRSFRRLIAGQFQLIEVSPVNGSMEIVRVWFPHRTWMVAAEVRAV